MRDYFTQMLSLFQYEPLALLNVLLGKHASEIVIKIQIVESAD